MLFYIKPLHSGVLVRNNAIKTTLKERHRGSIIKSVLIPISIIYLTHIHRTIYESKGLEFDDVSFLFPLLTLLLTQSRSYYITSSRIQWQPPTSGALCLIMFLVEAVSKALQHLMRLNMQSCVERCVDYFLMF